MSMNNNFQEHRQDNANERNRRRRKLLYIYVYIIYTRVKILKVYVLRSDKLDKNSTIGSECVFNFKKD